MFQEGHLLPPTPSYVASLSHLYVARSRYVAAYKVTTYYDDLAPQRQRRHVNDNDSIAATTAGKQGLRQRQRSVGAAVSTIEWTPTTIMHDAAEPRIGEVIRLSQRQRRRQAAGSGSNDCRRRNISSIGDGGCGSSNNSNSSDRNNSGSMKNVAILAARATTQRRPIRD